MIGQLALKTDILDKIKTDPLLYGQICDALGISPASLPRLLNNKDAKLTQASVLMILRKHLGVTKDTDLLEEIHETITA